MRATYDITKRHILDAGQQIIAVKGFAGVGLSEILSAADIPKGSFYHYFGSKEQYGCALLEQYFDEYLVKLKQILHAPFDASNTAQSARYRLLQYWGGWVESQSSHDPKGRCMVVKLGAEVADLSDDMRIALCKGTKRLMEQLAICITEGITEGSLDSQLNPEKTAEMLYQMWLGASLLAKLQRDRRPLENAMETTISVLKQG
ncbi:TetR/AcrR family transcriptional regulator [Glaciimonas sp. CA11.2]|uniref:TetR/AcrR family transcriptional regulator n=1 Tax=unclassified Glaciimonas TaxID=2644401 RepID=UPI002AB58C40|nr:MULTISPECIES: TetR/AcrR family transcriptional regulator [unclassified Glaciimonas]MDY7544865.1 TetR/AcrR family transcriptional regulator [Glaciimonas sp. CA11.2]MEB0014145.1 TetR/AcrR family transcriptional regulator [Glaciimonas sp. Cout2]MEB0083462.1 TetR/AcrR family transcriptional regulator [Glaciimonas sp. Gout2]MEB0162900.1 TetR/AcrR family transcriptional regulator [Glaciimonas sp. CA11.2]